jgi:hypothetical protein
MADPGLMAKAVFILDAVTGSFLADLALVDLLEAALFTSDFLMTAIGLFLECRILIPSCALL